MNQNNPLQRAVQPEASAIRSEFLGLGAEDFRRFSEGVRSVSMSLRDMAQTFDWASKEFQRLQSNQRFQAFFPVEPSRFTPDL